MTNQITFLTKYQEDATRTMAYKHVVADDLAHMIIGINSEMNELEDAIENNDAINIGEEIADIYWYLANYCTLRGIDLNNLFPHLSVEHYMDGVKFKEQGKIDNVIKAIYYATSKLNNLVKRLFVYGKAIDSEAEFLLLLQLANCTDILLSSYDLEHSQVMEANINKLKVRYPEKFTSDLAINRDLETERKVLEDSHTQDKK